LQNDHQIEPQAKIVSSDGILIGTFD